MTQVPSAIEREMYFQQLSEEFDMPLDTLKQQFQSLHLKSKQKQTFERKERQKQLVPSNEQPLVRKNASTTSSVERAEKQLLNRLFHFEEARFQLNSFYPDFQFYTEDYELIYTLFKEISSEKNEGFSAFMEYLNDSTLKEKLVEIEWLSLGDTFHKEELDDCVRVIHNQYRIRDK